MINTILKCTTNHCVPSKGNFHYKRTTAKSKAKQTTDLEENERICALNGI